MKPDEIKVEKSQTLEKSDSHEKTESFELAADQVVKSFVVVSFIYYKIF